MYLSRAKKNNVMKLFGITENYAGIGMAESEVVRSILINWDIKKEVVSKLFDTTASNSSGEVGACIFLEKWVGYPFLSAACHHHIYELNEGRLVQAVTGQTKDPGVGLFRRLKAKWHKLNINYDNLHICLTTVQSQCGLGS